MSFIETSNLDVSVLLEIVYISLLKLTDTLTNTPETSFLYTVAFTRFVRARVKRDWGKKDAAARTVQVSPGVSPWACRWRSMMPILSEAANIVVVNILRPGAHSTGFLLSRVAAGRPFDLAKASANSESWEFDWPALGRYALTRPYRSRARHRN